MVPRTGYTDPEVESQVLYYSGHRHFHCLNTHVGCDAYDTIRYIESGYAGHLNDAQQFGLMQQLGTDLIFPEELCLLADKIYPNRSPVLTPYTSAQITRKSLVDRRKCRKFNSLILKYGIYVEHATADIKTNTYVGLFWRHPRNMLSCTVRVCTSLVCRRKAIGLIL